MKPTKNHIYCRDCGRTKMLFESEKKALNFIKFNGDEIMEESGKKPVRAYYCPLCCGWHVTSRAEAREGFHSINERWVDSCIERKRAKQEKLEAKQKAKSMGVTSEVVLQQEKIRKVYEEANDVLTLIQRNLDNGRYVNAQEALKVISGMMASYMDIEFLSATRKSILSKVKRLTEMVDASIRIYGTDVDMPAIVAKVRETLHGADVLFDYGLYDDANQTVCECISTLEHYQMCALMEEDRSNLLKRARRLKSLIDDQMRKTAA